MSAHAESLADAWRIAADHNPVLAAAHAQQREADANKAAADSLEWPSVTLSASRLRLSETPQASVSTAGIGSMLKLTPLAPYAGLIPTQIDASLAAKDVQWSNLSVTYPLYTSGRISAARAAAQAGSNLAQAQAHSTLADLRLSIAQSYVDVLRAQAAVHVVTLWLDSLELHERDVVALEKQGLAAPVERLTAQVAVSQARARLAQATQAEALARAAYNRWLGRALDADTHLDAIDDASIPAAQSAGSSDESSMMERAIAQREELRALRSGQDVLIDKARAVRAESGPQLAIQAAQINWSGLPTAQNHVATIGIGLNWNLFDGGLVRNRASAVRAEADVLAEQTRDVEARIRLQVRQARLAILSAQARCDATRNAGQAAQEAQRLTDKRFANGMATQTEVLAAHTRLADAQREDNDARYDLQLARLHWAHALGEL